MRSASQAGNSSPSTLGVSNQSEGGRLSVVTGLTPVPEPANNQGRSMAERTTPSSPR